MCVAPRDPARPKAAHLSDHSCLRSLARGQWPPQEYELVPLKVLATKREKLTKRGLVSAHGELTPAGREVIAETWPSTQGESDAQVQE
jgi:hypothetical protein